MWADAGQPTGHWGHLRGGRAEVPTGGLSHSLQPRAPPAPHDGAAPYVTAALWRGARARQSGLARRATSADALSRAVWRRRDFCGRSGAGAGEVRGARCEVRLRGRATRERERGRRREERESGVCAAEAMRRKRINDERERRWNDRGRVETSTPRRRTGAGAQLESNYRRWEEGRAAAAAEGGGGCRGRRGPFLPSAYDERASQRETQNAESRRRRGLYEERNGARARGAERELQQRGRRAENKVLDQRATRKGQFAGLRQAANGGFLGAEAGEPSRGAQSRREPGRAPQFERPGGVRVATYGARGAAEQQQSSGAAAEQQNSSSATMWGSQAARRGVLGEWPGPGGLISLVFRSWGELGGGTRDLVDLGRGEGRREGRGGRREGRGGRRGTRDAEARREVAATGADSTSHVKADGRATSGARERRDRTERTTDRTDETDRGRGRPAGGEVQAGSCAVERAAASAGGALGWAGLATATATAMASPWHSDRLLRAEVEGVEGVECLGVVAVAAGDRARPGRSVRCGRCGRCWRRPPARTARTGWRNRREAGGGGGGGGGGGRRTSSFPAPPADGGPRPGTTRRAGTVGRRAQRSARRQRAGRRAGGQLVCAVRAARSKNVGKCG